MFRKLKNQFFSQKKREEKKRPYFNLRGSEIEVLYRNSLDDVSILEKISVELAHRKSPNMAILKGLVEERLGEIKKDCGVVSIPKDESINNKKMCRNSSNETDHHSDDFLFLNNFISFSEVVKKISRSPKPESLIDSETWNMFTRSLMTSDLKYRKLKEAATSLDLIWPEIKKDDEINDYIDLGFDQLKEDYGFEQKKVIISAVAIASYTHVKSWRLLKNKYGTNDQSVSDSLKEKKVSTAGSMPCERIVNVGVKPSPEITVKNNSEATITVNSSPYFFNSLLNFKAPWNCIKKTTWDKWRESINQNQQMLTVSDVAKHGQFQCNKSLNGVSIGELLNFEFGYLDSFSDHADRRAVFYAVAFLGLGNRIQLEPRIAPANKDKSVSNIQYVPDIESKSAISTENDTVNDILEDFGL